MQQSEIKLGQRWVSESEPELGLGVMQAVEFNRVEIYFPAVEEKRIYALKSAPIQRVTFKVGDKLELLDGSQLDVDAVQLADGLLTYQCGELAVVESELAHTISFSKPDARLLLGQADDPRDFALRTRALRHDYQLSQSPLRGFVGGRMDLIPHQMYIASEVASRLKPRVLLADEVGLGKTIEAGLIMHRLHLTGRASRILVIVPEPLVNQWFVEMLRRFQLMFAIFDEERCQSIEANEDGVNPFMDSQLVLCSQDFLLQNPARAQQVISAGWDLLAVDEAHHLEWSENESSAAYGYIEQLAGCIDAVLLLTATPQQLGPEGHFARLRLLDPIRYHSLEKFVEENLHYQEVARIVDELQSAKPLAAADAAMIASRSPQLAKRCELVASGDAASRDSLIADLLDAFGTGRVMFRNTRSALQGFPERKAHLHELPAGDEFANKLEFLLDWLRQNDDEKLLLICRTREMVGQIQQAVQEQLNVKCAQFHEDMTLLQRDRAAVYFSDPEGAQLMICSEIGSEGRNFQFAHHLLLFDLPADPELLEQRIGRLDRIGQTSTINIHVPFQLDHSSEVLAKWYHHGLDSFEHHQPAAVEVFAHSRDQLESLFENFDRGQLDELLVQTRQHCKETSEKMANGHDRLLQMNSSKPERAAELIESIRDEDELTTFENFIIYLLDRLGAKVEELGDRAYLIKPGHVVDDHIAGIPDEGIWASFDRTVALSREDMVFLTRDHPLVRGALDSLLSDHLGSSSFAVWRHPLEKKILLQANLLLEAHAPASMHLDRFLAATPISLCCDHQLAEVLPANRPPEAALRSGNHRPLLAKDALRLDLLPKMVDKLHQLAELQSKKIIKQAEKSARTELDHELDRLQALAEINDTVNQREIDELKKHRDEVMVAISNARVRMDSIRLIWKAPK